MYKRTSCIEIILTKNRTCAIYEALEIRIAIRPTSISVMRSSYPDVRNAGIAWESAMQEGHKSYMGLHSGRHWFRLHSKEIARVWAYWEQDDKVIEPKADEMVVGFLGWCQYVQDSKHGAAGREKSTAPGDSFRSRIQVDLDRVDTELKLIR